MLVMGNKFNCPVDLDGMDLVDRVDWVDGR